METQHLANKEQLIKLIKQSKTSVFNIGQLSGVSYRTIEQWLYGGITPTIDKAIAVLNALGYEIEIKEK